MLKRPHRNIAFADHGIVLYDRAKSDLFVQRNNHAFLDGPPYNDTKPVYPPSITTIFLLQLQASIIQAISALPPRTAGAARRFFVVSLAQQALRWALILGLFVLDNVAHVLNVDNEMADIKQRQQEDEQSSHHLTYITAESTGSDNGLLHTSFTTEGPDFPVEQDEEVREDHAAKDKSNDYTNPLPMSIKSDTLQLSRQRCPRPCCENLELVKSIKATCSMPSSPSSPTPTFSYPPSIARSRKISSPSALTTGPVAPKKVDHSATSGMAQKHNHVRSHSIPNIDMDEENAQNAADKVQPRGGSMSSQLLTSHHTLRRTNAQRDLTTKPAVVTPVEKRTKPVVTTKKPSNARGQDQVKPIVVNPSTSTGNSSTSSQSSSPVSVSHPTTGTIDQKSHTNPPGYTEDPHNHPHHHHHHHHDAAHNQNIRTMGDYLHEKPLIRKEQHASKPASPTVIPWRT
ncbi:hypothetical protein DFQ28_002394 [Apophysomyces sp. BC1034]|nr:hypothetical protein DFQ30_002945 [Apophysomyces sp. BC1015]KAG0179172.1 hypothetical protein DFQ29_002427 [Apophysomyces sp. BC1021]KAG0190207.1 hypothetical protein DFQ28_002394 [Apophysomyces sp. BC1034]